MHHSSNFCKCTKLALQDRVDLRLLEPQCYYCSRRNVWRLNGWERPLCWRWGTKSWPKVFCWQLVHHLHIDILCLSKEPLKIPKAIESRWEKSGGRATIPGSTLSVCLWLPTPVLKSIPQVSLWRLYPSHQFPSVRIVTLSTRSNCIAPAQRMRCMMSRVRAMLPSNLRRWTLMPLLPLRKASELHDFR